ncbi:MULTISPECIES: AMP-binding protein [Rhodomicrobium]|uniref:class I adenylate-forming enzyme family protein n=1 Tax=Rhodomicrobium TaxID=1068 RepID=UPI000B4B44BA|nr:MULTISPECIES: AMP-binding protein [Rhodomicrobium]
MNLAEWLVRSARRAGSSPALFDGERPVADYAGFAGRAARMATALREKFAIGPDDRVAMFMPNSTDYLELFYAVWFTGAAVVPINVKLHTREAAWIIGDAEAKLVFALSDTCHELQNQLPGTRLIAIDSAEFAALRASEPMAEPLPRARDDLAWLFYTSGTTGKPKGVMISNGNLHAMAFAYLADVDDVPPGDAALYAAPISHGAGLYNVVNVLRGARHVVPASGGFDPAEILALGRALGGITMFAAPTMVRRLVERAKAQGETGEGLRSIIYGGGPMYLSDIEEAVAAMGPRFIQIYGQGESPMTITALPRGLVADRAHPRWRERLGSVGTAQSCVELRVADADGRALPPGETGEILVRGAPVMLGYWRNEAASAAALKDGWLWTGDVGALDADGFLTLKDRSKDVIISGGSNIYPREVEEALLLHPSVEEVSVIGRASPEWGEDVVAFIVAAPGSSVDPAALDSHCREHIARFKRPKHYIALAELPKNNYGKVLKTELRARLAEIFRV